MTQPVDGPASVADVKAYLSVTDNRLDVAIGEAVAATNVFVRRLPVAQLAGDVELPWPANVSHGAVMLASRLVRRRNSPSGVEAMTEAGAVYVNRNDPDIALMLELGRYSRPAVG